MMVIKVSAGHWKYYFRDMITRNPLTAPAFFVTVKDETEVKIQVPPELSETAELYVERSR